MDVIVLVVEHKYGRDICVYQDEIKARQELHEYVKEYWGSWFLETIPIPSNPDKAIQMYFENAVEQESYSLDTYHVIGSKP